MKCINYDVTEYSNGLILWKLSGKLHRENGPALEGLDGVKEYYLNGKEPTKEEFNKINKVESVNEPSECRTCSGRCSCPNSASTWVPTVSATSHAEGAARSAAAAESKRRDLRREIYELRNDPDAIAAEAQGQGALRDYRTLLEIEYGEIL